LLDVILVFIKDLIIFIKKYNKYLEEVS